MILKPGNHFEVPHVDRSHSEPEFDGGGTDEEILKRDVHPVFCQLAFNPAGKSSGLQRNRVHAYVGYKGVNKRLTSSAPVLVSRSKHSMRQFYYRDGGQPKF